MAYGPFIAVDWGTTNRRAWLIEDGRVLAAERDARGILSIPAGGYPDEIAAIRSRLGDLPTLLAGMVGSDRGWMDSGYVPCPAHWDAIAAGLLDVGEGIRIVPGVRTASDRRPDVMRGEEVQLLGAISVGQVPDDALLCQPGTHTKWASVRGGVIVGFATAMAGELFALLRAHALVGRSMADHAVDSPAFREGLARSGNGDLLVALFEGRPASLLSTRQGDEITSFVSGLIIGADVRAQVRSGATVHLVADPMLGGLYAASIDAVGGMVVLIESEAAFVAGITRIWELAS